MPTVTNTTDEILEVPLYGLIFGPGESIEVDDEAAADLGGPLKVDWPAPEPPAPAGDTPAASETTDAVPPTGGTP